MRLKNVPGAKEAVERHPLCILAETRIAGKWHETFGNGHPIYVEIGMGKGKFITELSALHPEYNFLGIEKYSSVLIRALEKIEKPGRPEEPECSGRFDEKGEMETTKRQNIRFLRMDAQHIETMFAPGEVTGIYLNFSDPWPKDRHAKRRLTSREFLKHYERIMEEDGKIEFKTDNLDLFRFSIEEAKSAGWRVDECTWDLHGDPGMSIGNIMSEYEEKFSALGNPICKMILSHHSC